MKSQDHKSDKDTSSDKKVCFQSRLLFMGQMNTATWDTRMEFREGVYDRTGSNSLLTCIYTDNKHKPEPFQNQHILLNAN